MNGKKAMETIPLSPSSVNQTNSCKHDLQMMSELLDNNTNHSTITVVYDLLHGILKL